MWTWFALGFALTSLVVMTPIGCSYARARTDPAPTVKMMVVATMIGFAFETKMQQLSAIAVFAVMA
jgi:FtsH-binding integral membrane protein